MEEEAASDGRKLRQSTLSHKPGHYEESQAYGVQIPSWVHPPILFDHTLPRHCSFPSVPLNQPGRADAYVAARERGDINEKNTDSGYDESDEEGCQTPAADNNENSCQTVAHNISERSPERGKPFKEFLLNVTNDLDWGSPEPEDIGEPIEWCQVTLGGQWVLLLALCQYKAFVPATQLLKMKVTDIMDFVGLYIRCHRETKQWANEISGTTVEVLLQMAKGVGASADKTNALKRPCLPTDILQDHERVQAINYLLQVGQFGFVEEVNKWRGHSTTFHTLPIEPEIMAACSVILDKGMGSLEVKNIKLPQSNKARQSLLWLGGVQSEFHNLAKCLGELEAYLPHLTFQDKLSVVVSSQTRIHTDKEKNSLTTTINYRKMDELYDPELLSQHRVPSVDLSGYPDFSVQKKDENILLQEQNSMQEPQPLFDGLKALPRPKVPTIQISKASPQAESDHTMSGEISVGRLLLPVRSLHLPGCLPGPNLGSDTYSFPERVPVGMQSHNYMPTYTGTNNAAFPTVALNPSYINQGEFSQSRQLKTSSVMGGSTLSFPSFGNTFPGSPGPNFPSSGKTFQDPHRQASSYATQNYLGQKTTAQTIAPLPVVSKSMTRNISVPESTKQEKRAATSPAQIDNYPESPAALSSRKSTQRQRSDSDEEYRPRPKRPRKSNSNKSTLRKKENINLLQPSLPQLGPNPKPVTQLQTGTANTLQPVKRGRGRPRKHPRPQDLVTQPTQDQLSTLQASADNPNAQVSATNVSRTSNGGHPASAPDPSTGKEAGCQAFTEGLTAATIPIAASASASTSAKSSPQYCSHVFQPYNAPHATHPEPHLSQTRTNVSRDVVMHLRPNSYEEFWETHQNLALTARRGHGLSYSMPDVAAPSFAPSGPEKTLGAEVAFSPVSGQVRSDIRQSPQAATQCASGIQKRLQD